MPNALSVEPVKGSFAARVFGVDFSSPPSEDVRDAIVAALERHHVLVFPDQRLDKRAQLALTLAFGELDEHAAMNSGADVPEVHTVSNLDADGLPAAARLGSQHWHSDKSYRQVPSTITFLYAVEVPGRGGDTQFADMASAFEALPDDERERLSKLRIVHSWEDSVARSGGTITDEERRKWPPIAHPLARLQPDGRRALFMGQHAAFIDGVSREESDALMARLHTHGTSDRFVYQHEWRAGDLLMWDNRCLLHRVLPNFKLDAERRILHRTVTRGDAIPI